MSLVTGAGYNSSPIEDRTNIVQEYLLLFDKLHHRVVQSFSGVHQCNCNVRLHLFF